MQLLLVRETLYTLSLLLLVTLWTSNAYSQPATDSFIDNVKVTSRINCALLRVQFHAPIRYIRHFPVDQGSDLNVVVQPVDAVAVEERLLSRSQAAPVQGATLGGVTAVTMDARDAANPVLRIQFKRSVRYTVAQFGSIDTINVIYPLNNSSVPCQFDETLDGAQPDRSSRANIELALPGTTGRGVRDANSPAVKGIQTSLEEARAAIWRKKPQEAIRILEQALQAPETKLTPDVLELLGDAAQAAGQTGRAREVYQDYLKRYPQNEGSARVAMRLHELEGLASPRNRPQDAAANFDPFSKTPTADERGLSTYAISGEISAFYIRDDSYNQAKNIAIAPDPNADPDAHRFHQNTFLTTLDTIGALDNESVTTKFKLSATDEHRIQADTADSDRFGVSSAYVDWTFKDAGLRTRIGRQTRNNSGIIGRFDGALVSYDLSQLFRINAVGGSPNVSRFDAPFLGQRYFGGVSLDIVKPVEGLDLSLYAIQQNTRSLLDRRAIGGEYRYTFKNLNTVGQFDYDVHFNRINFAATSGSWTFDDKSVLAAGINFYRVPYLTTTNALAGQPFATLYDMLKFDTASQVREFAIDRSPKLETGMVSYSRPLTDHLTFATDATLVYTSSTPASGGVAGSNAVGHELYFSGLLVGTDIFKSGDLYSVQLRHAHIADSNVYFVDFNTRYPLTEDFSINPRLRYEYRVGRYTQLKEFTILPSVVTDYHIKKNLVFETELGAKWIQGKDQVGVGSTTRSLFVTLGLRSEFGSEGSYRCTGVYAPCLGMLTAPPADRPPGEALFYSPHALSNEPEPITSAFVVEGGIRYWRNTTRSHADYFAFTPANPIPQLSQSRLDANTGEVFARADVREGMLRNVFVKGRIGGGGGDGELSIGNFPQIGSAAGSAGAQHSSGSLGEGGVDLGYNVYTDDRLRLGAFAGFQTLHESLSGSSPATLVGGAVAEKNDWRSFRVGAVLDANLTDRLTWTNELALTSSAQRSLEIHRLDGATLPIRGRSGGFQSETQLSYQVADALYLGIGMRWWRFTTFATDPFSQSLKATTDRYGVFAQASYRMNLFNPENQGAQGQ